jgi:hypothetical protein
VACMQGKRNVQYIFVAKHYGERLKCFRVQVTGENSIKLELYS